LGDCSPRARSGALKRLRAPSNKAPPRYSELAGAGAMGKFLMGCRRNSYASLLDLLAYSIGSTPPSATEFPQLGYFPALLAIPTTMRRAAVGSDPR
jgi:hypothetical protein